MTDSVQEGLLITASPEEFNAEGEDVAIGDPSQITYAVDDATVGQIVTPADDPSIPVGSCKVKGLKVGTVNVTATDNSKTPPLVSEPKPLVVTQDTVANRLVVNFA